jgi:hypothetical protein
MNVNTVCLPLLYPEAIIEGLRVTVIGHGSTKNRKNRKGKWECMKIISALFKISIMIYDINDL